MYVAVNSFLKSLSRVGKDYLLFLCASAIADGFVLDESTTTAKNQANGVQILSTIAPVPCADEGDLNCAVADEYFHVCSDIDHAKTVCRLHCNLCNLVDGNWAEWSNWSSCDVTCGDGQLTRRRTCSNPAPANLGSNCTGADSEYKTCSLDPCPVHGGWSPWGSWGTCSVSCGVGIQRRDRTCTNPPPKYFGDHCFGDSNDNQLCFPGHCTDVPMWNAFDCSGTVERAQNNVCRLTTYNPIVCTNNIPPWGCQKYIVNICSNGGWSTWDSWSSCSNTCGVGTRTRNRYCDNPAPSMLGSFCRGTPIEYDICGDNADICVVHTNASCCMEYSVTQYDSNSTHAYKVRLCDGNGQNTCNPRKGRVEVTMRSTMDWGTVCSDVWDRNENAANVFCQSIGYRSGSTGYASQRAGPMWLPIHLINVDCTGNETNIFECNHWYLPRTYDCGHGQDVSVSCE